MCFDTMTNFPIQRSHLPIMHFKAKKDIWPCVFTHSFPRCTYTLFFFSQHNVLSSPFAVLPTCKAHTLFLEDITFQCTAHNPFQTRYVINSQRLAHCMLLFSLPPSQIIHKHNLHKLSVIVLYQISFISSLRTLTNTQSMNVVHLTGIRREQPPCYVQLHMLCGFWYSITESESVCVQHLFRVWTLRRSEAQRP